MAAKRLLILGTGSMAGAHARAFASEPGIKMVAAVEPNKERLIAFGKEHGIRQRFTDLDEAIAWGKFDAATNVTPDAVHHPTTMRLIATGKPMLCEKPLAPSYPLALEMTEAVKKAGIVAMVNLRYRAL